MIMKFSILFTLCLLLLMQPYDGKTTVDAKLHSQQARKKRRGIKGQKRSDKVNYNKQQNNRKLKEKNNKHKVVVEEEEKVRYSYPSKILSKSEEEFLGAQRYEGEVCLCSVDTVDFRYRSDFLVEAWDIDSEESLGYCLDFLPASTEGTDDGGDAATEASTPFLTMNECDPDASGQRWFFTRVAKKEPFTLFGRQADDEATTEGLYIIQNAASGLVLAAPPDEPDDDKYSYKRNWYDYDDDRYVTTYASTTGIFLTQLSRVEMDQDKILWSVNEERFFTLQAPGIFDFFDDDIFGFSLLGRGGSGGGGGNTNINNPDHND